MAGYTPTKTSLSRVYLIEGKARPDHVPDYQGTLMAGALSQGFGDIEKIEAPDPDNYGEFIEIGFVRGATERATTTIAGRYALALKSRLMELAIRRCQFDMQFHFGLCKDPRNFQDFNKAVILEDASITTYSTDDLGALASGDEAPVNETVDISAKLFYEVLPMNFGLKASSLITNEVLGVVICGAKACGDCGDENAGCDKIYAVTKAAGGSPSTPPDILFSLDKGVTLIAHDIDTLTSAQDADDIGCLGAYAVVISNAANSLNYVELSELKANNDPAWTEITTGFVTGGEPKAIDVANGKAFIVGDLGYIYSTDDPTAGVVNDDAGVATTDDLLDVDALSDTFAVAVGRNGVVLLVTNGTTWSALTRPVGAGVHINCVAVKNEREWLIGTSAGNLYYTNDQGDTWTVKPFPGSASGQVRDVKFATNSVVYLAHSTSAPAGRILRSYDGGHEWLVLPEGDANLPANDYIGKLAACSYDPNFVVGGGLADDAADGVLVVGTA